MSTFKITPSWRWQMRFWAFVSAGIVVLVSVVPGCQPSDDRARMALLVGFTLATVFFVWYDRSLGRTISTDDEIVESREASGRATRIPLRAVTKVVNHMRLGYLYVIADDGQRIRIEHQIENAQDLVAHIVNATGCTVEER